MTACGAREVLLGRRTAVRGAASRGGCRFTADDRGEGFTPLPTLIVEGTGGLAARPGSCRRIACQSQYLRQRESRSACGVVNVWVARGRPTIGGTRGAVAGTRRGGAGVRAARRGVHRAVGSCRYAAGACRSVGTPDAAPGANRGGAAGPAPARGGAGRHTVRCGRRGGGRSRRDRGERRHPGRSRRAVGGREIGHPLRVRDLLSGLAALAAPPAARAARPAVPAGGDRQPGAVGTGSPGPERSVRRAAQHPPGVDRPAANGRRPPSRLHRSPVAGVGPDPQSVAGARGPQSCADRRLDPAGRTPTPGRLGGIPRRWHTPGVRRLRQYTHERLDGHRSGRDRGDPRAGPPRPRRPRLGRPGPDR
jgi:hypothetical protein